MIFKGEGYVRFNNKTYEFVDGILEVTDVNMIEKMKEYYEVTGEGRKTEQGNIEGHEVITEQEESKEEIDYSTMTNAELKEILDTRGIEYSNRASKSELLELIK